MSILYDTELTPDELLKITNSLNETEAIESNMMLEKQAEHERQQRHASRTMAVTVISVSCAIIAFFVIATIIFASIFAPQH